MRANRRDRRYYQKAIPLSAEIVNRGEFSKLLRSRGLHGTAVEVGTHIGEFAEEFLSGWHSGILICVDPWETGMANYCDPLSDRNRDIDYTAAVDRLTRYGNRIVIRRQTAEAAAVSIQHNSLDFVYLDGNHGSEFIAADAFTWWGKVKRGGILAGHDLDGEWLRNVGSVVVALAQVFGVHPYRVPGPMDSWYIEKPLLTPGQDIV